MSVDRRLRLLILGAGRHQTPLIRRAEERGIETVAADYYEDSPGKRFASHAVLADAFDTDLMLQTAREFDVDGVMTVGTDQAIVAVARVAEALGLPCHVSSEGALRATHKSAMREALAAADVPMTESSPTTDSATGRVELPVVVKAADSQGQRGLSIVHDRADLASAVEAARAVSPTGTVVVEKFHVGPELTINAWMRDGEVEHATVLDRVTFNPPPSLGICLQHVYPSMHADRRDECADIARGVATAYDLRSGPLYIQSIVTEDGVRVVEAAARVGGGHEAQLFPRLIDLHPIDRSIDLALGFEPSSHRSSGSPAGLVNFIVARPGAVSELSSMEALAADGGIDEGGWYVAPGHVQADITDSMGRVGYFIVTGSTRSDAIARASAAYSALEVVDEGGANLAFWPPHDVLNDPSTM